MVGSESGADMIVQLVLAPPVKNVQELQEVETVLAGEKNEQGSLILARHASATSIIMLSHITLPL